MHRIVLPDLVRLLARVGARRIGDPALPVALAEATAERGAAFRDGVLRAEADAAASVELHVFNATGDRDSGGVLGTRRRKSGPREADDGRPLLLKLPGQAWLRISMEAEADALARGARGATSAQAAAGAEARLLAYRRHDADARCAEAIAVDLARFPDARSADDVRALGVGDACAVQAEGTLSATVSVSWSVLLSAAAPALAGAFGPHAPAFLVEVPAEGGATLAVSITDGFSVAFARQQAAGHAAYRVVLRRRHLDERTVDASLGVEVAFADPDAVAGIVPDALALLLDVPREALREIRDATSLRAVPARLRPVASMLFDRLGIRDAEPLATLRERLEALDARLAGRIEALARTRAAVVLEAEYRRLATDVVLLEAELSEAALRRLHPPLLALDAATVLADRGPGVAAMSLLHDRTVERLQGWSIGASLGSWFELASAQRRQDRFVERRRVDGSGDRTRHEYFGATRYTARANGWSTTYGATFEAVDDGAGGGTACALQLWWEEGRVRATPDGLARIVDDAVLWGIVTADAAPALHARLQAALDGVGRCKPRFELFLEHDATRAALARLAHASPGEWALHAARALPRNGRVAARADCTTRGAVYGPAFARLGDVHGPALRRHLASALRDADPRLAARERSGDAPWTAWRVLRQAGLARRGPAGAWRDWAGAAASLQASLADVDADAGDAFAALRIAFEQPFTLRTVASLLAGTTPSGARLSLAFEREGEARSLLVGA